MILWLAVQAVLGIALFVFIEFSDRIVDAVLGFDGPGADLDAE